MCPSIEDARNYITIKPVPAWEEAADSTLAARSLNNYTLTLPTRNQVFKSNYARRLYQRKAQGYYSLPWKPYQEVGKPLHLDPKVLVQSSLGQESPDDKGLSDENINGNLKTGSGEKFHRKKTLKENGPEQQTDKVKKSTKFMSTASFLMKHIQQENLQDIVKDLNNVRETLANVKMGHALFPMLQEEQNNRENAFLVDKQNQMKVSRQGMHIHSITDDDLTEGEDEERMQKRPQSRQMSLRRAGSRASMVSAPLSVNSATSPAPGMVARKAEVKKSLGELARPFTPVHSNINASITAENTHFRVWKQLCVLHWILEACRLEVGAELHQHKVMIPLSECWDELNPGGRTRDSRIVVQEKRNNSKWIKFTRNPSSRIVRNRSRRKVPSFPSHQSTMRRNASYASDLASCQGENTARQRPPSARSVSLNPPPHHHDNGIYDYSGEYPGVVRPSRPSSPGQSSIATTIAAATVAGSEYGDDDVDAVDVDGEKRREPEDFLNERDYHEHLKKLLSTVKDSVDSEMQRRERTARYVAEINKRLQSSVAEWAHSSYFTIGKKEVNITKIVVPSATPVTDYSETAKPVQKTSPVSRIRPHTAAVIRRRDSTAQSTRDQTFARPGSAFANTKPKHTRPMSSPAKLVTQYSFKFPSTEKEKKLGEMREKFKEVNDTKALQLHHRLTEFEMLRRQRMEVKFDKFVTSSSMHRDLSGMRTAAIAKIKDRIAKKKRFNMTTSDWHSTLIEHLPQDIRSDENCNNVLSRLAMLGIEMAASVHRVTPSAFLGALKQLRPWELCSPDVSGAVEFVREHVVGMDASEFDEWREAKLSQKDPIVGSDSKTK